MISKPFNADLLAAYVANPSLGLPDGKVQSTLQLGYRFWNMTPVAMAVNNEQNQQIDIVLPWSYSQGTLTQYSRYLTIRPTTTIPILDIPGVTQFQFLADTREGPLGPRQALLSYSQVVNNSETINTVQPVFLKTLFDNSGTIAAANTSQELLAASNLNQRSYILIQNLQPVGGGNLWVNFGAAAAAAQGSILIPPGEALIWEDFTVPQQEIFGLGSVTGQAYTLKYGGN